jgi:hypothetical protein
MIKRGQRWSLWLNRNHFCRRLHCVWFNLALHAAAQPRLFVPADFLSRLDLIQLYARSRAEPSNFNCKWTWLSTVKVSLAAACFSVMLRHPRVEMYLLWLGVCSGAVALVIYFSRYPFSHGNRPNHENTGGRRHPFYTRDVFIQHGHFSHQIYTIKSFNRRYPSSVFAEVKSDTLFCGLPFSDRSHCLRW